jgi:hypothetical protein
MLLVVRVLGGLGNQLFQYAFAQRLLAHYNCDIKLDISGYAHYAKRIFLLDRFCTSFAAADGAEVRRLTRFPLHRLQMAVRSRLRGLPRRCPSHLVECPEFVYHPEVLQLQADTYLDGYWQTPDYAAPIAESLRQQLTLKAAPSPQTQSLLADIYSRDSVSVHVRRGDYVLPNDDESTTVASRTYYHRCLASLSNKIQAPHFYVFSDDIPWVRENLAFAGPVQFVEHNGQQHPEEDLLLMAACRYHIIANSSFSWWGSWLGNDSTGAVLCPAVWSRDRQVTSEFIVPSSWTRIAN